MTGEGLDVDAAEPETIYHEMYGPFNEPSSSLE